MLLAMTILTVGVLGNSVNAATMSAASGVVDFQRGEAQITISGNEGQSLAGKTFRIYQLFYAENAVNKESINYKWNPDFKAALQKVVSERIGKEDEESVTE